MWKQIFNQIWNQRRTNAWLWTELCIVTVLLWYGVQSQIGRASCRERV